MHYGPSIGRPGYYLVSAVIKIIAPIFAEIAGLPLFPSGLDARRGAGLTLLSTAATIRNHPILGVYLVLALMSMFTASSTIDFLSHIKDHGREAMFRGQADLSWPLLPSIARYADNLEPEGYDCIFDLEDHLLDRFRILGVPFRDFRSIPRFEQLIHAQHYGLPTRLLDWSTNPLKALFFAVEDPQLDGTDATVYMTRPRFWVEGTTNLEDDGEYAACFPELLHERISAQDACVLAFPLSKSSMHVPELSVGDLPRSLEFLHKVTVPSSCKRKLRKQLAVLGVTHRTVYPGLEGTTRWIKSELSEFKV